MSAREHVVFDDNLYEYSDKLRQTGCGLKGWCRNASWFYERHDSMCRPGMWLVGITSPHADGFQDKLAATYCNAVVDDFGSLVRVP